ncbi:acyl transferase [Daejeonella sp.]|uniref:LuxE/PaaK family acyltransferase n=1 Tax=Daejeonella sp. TaxID=2805397 RepID=UPI00272F650B|nr:acyl transferase [Daejeonella sp.]MDP2415585.1 acyl transferase [Daejeonella sp.]
MQNLSPDRIFSVSDSLEFEKLSLDIFNYQVRKCEVYERFVSNLGIDIREVKDLNSIPFLPIEFFKSQKISCSKDEPGIIFSSSGTTALSQSRHFVHNIDFYIQSYRTAFSLFYGEISNYTVLALLPSYLERDGSSLIYMVNDLISLSKHQKSGYFLDNHDLLKQTLQELKASESPTILIGVTYALLDFVENHSIEFPELIVMETGGMKGKRREILRTELHEVLCAGFGVPGIHSEYGMTELLSQAYSKGSGIFQSPPWIKVRIRDTNDPLTLLGNESTGGLNIIDLANVHSCSFIATQDLGKCYADGSFEVLGRFDHSDIRGCNLLVQ